MRDTL